MHVQLDFVRKDKGADKYAFCFGRQTYYLLGRGAAEEADLDWDDGLVDDLAALQRAGAGSELEKRVGALLRDFLVRADWEVHESRILSALAAGEEVVLTIRSAAAELYVLPWELMLVDGSERHLGELDGLLIHYEWTKMDRPAPVASQASRPVLVAYNGAVPAEPHIRAIEAAAAAAGLPFDRDRDVLSSVSRRSLRERLAESPPRVLHLLCHGAKVDESYGLSWYHPEKGSEIVDGAALTKLLGRTLNPARPSRATTVVLCACNSADGGDLGSRVGSAAQAIHRAGAEAVVASRFPLSKAASVELVEALYGPLLAGESVDAAFGKARARLLDEDGLDWAALQLHARRDELGHAPFGEPISPRRDPATWRRSMGLVGVWAGLLALVILVGNGGMASDEAAKRDDLAILSTAISTRLAPRPDASDAVVVLGMYPTAGSTGDPEPCDQSAPRDVSLPPSRTRRSPKNYRKDHPALVKQLSDAGARSIVFDIEFGASSEAGELYYAPLAEAVRKAVKRGTAVVIATSPTGELTDAGQALRDAGAWEGSPMIGGWSGMLLGFVAGTVPRSSDGRVALSLLAILPARKLGDARRGELPRWDDRDSGGVGYSHDDHALSAPERWTPAWPKFGGSDGIRVRHYLGWLNGVDPVDVRNKTVVVGWMCRDYDVVDTPVGRLNGVLAHAAAISGIERGEFVRVVGRAPRLLILLGFLGGIGAATRWAPLRGIQVPVTLGVGGTLLSLCLAVGLASVRVQWSMFDGALLAIGAAVVFAVRGRR